MVNDYGNQQQQTHSIGNIGNCGANIWSNQYDIHNTYWNWAIFKTLLEPMDVKMQHR